MFPRPFNARDRFSHNYYQGLNGYYLPTTYSALQRGEPPRLVPEPSVFVLQVASLNRFCVADRIDIPYLLSKIASKQGDLLHCAYWRFANQGSERMTFETARIYGLIPDPPDYTQA